MIIREEIGDLFELEDTHVLVHCISRDCEMGAGIALEFNNRYDGLKYSTLNYIKNVEPKCLAIGVNVNDYKIINLITKYNYYDKPTNMSMKMSLSKLREICKVNGISKIAMPRIGCGLDRLNWRDVYVMMESTFSDMDIEIVIRRKGK